MSLLDKGYHKEPIKTDHTRLMKLAKVLVMASLMCFVSILVIKLLNPELR